MSANFIRVVLQAAALLGLAVPLAPALAQSCGNETGAETASRFIGPEGTHPYGIDCVNTPSACGPGSWEAANWLAFASGVASPTAITGPVQV